MRMLGIIGYSGDDKLRVAHLYGETLSWMLKNRDSLDETPSYDYTIEYMKWCEYIEAYKLAPTEGIYYASFSHPLKMTVALMTGIPFSIMNVSEKKNKYIININTLEYREREGSETLITPEKLWKIRNKKLSITYDEKQELPQNTWMTINDYIIYFGYYICRNYVGKNIWTNAEKQTISRYPITDIRIYTDIRNKSEYDFIKDNEGYIIRLDKSVERPCVVYDSSLMSVEVDSDLPHINNYREILDRIYHECYHIINKWKNL